MANLNETDEWPNGIYQWEEDDPVLGGPAGIDNVPPRQLASRTRFQRLRSVTPWLPALSYPANVAYVSHGGSTWKSVDASLGVEPGTDPAKWVRWAHTEAQLQALLGTSIDGHLAAADPHTQYAPWLALSHLIDASGLTPDRGDNAQLLHALALLTGGRFLNVQTFSAAGASAYVATEGTRIQLVECIGAGGGSPGVPTTDGVSRAAGGGGGGGAYALALLVVPALSATVTVGAGGAAGTAGSSTGGVGGSSSFGTYLTTNGGAGPMSPALNPTGNVAFTGGGSGGTFISSNNCRLIWTAAGQDGEEGWQTSTQTRGGNGGPSGKGGKGGLGVYPSLPGGIGRSPGSGAGGAANGISTAQRAGTAGTAGQVNVWELS